MLYATLLSQAWLFTSSSEPSHDHEKRGLIVGGAEHVRIIGGSEATAFRAPPRLDRPSTRPTHPP